jgi:hypothetical protein
MATEREKANEERTKKRQETRPLRESENEATSAICGARSGAKELRELGLVVSCQGQRTAIRSTGEMCTLARTKGLYVSKKSEDRLLKDCEKSDL